MNSKVKNAFKYLFVIAALGFMVVYIMKNWSALEQYDWQFDIGLFALSMLVLWMGITVGIILFRLIFKLMLGIDIKFLQVFKMNNIANIGRYIPGKLWSVMGIFYFTDRLGISKKQTSVAILVNESTSKGSALLLGLLYFFFSSSHISYLPYMLALLVLALVFIHPKILEKVLNIILGILKREKISLDISYQKILLVFLLYTTVWILCSLGFYLMVKSITPLESVNVLKFMTIFPFSWVIGYLVLFAPGGLGVREGIITAMLAEFVMPEVALVVALLQRIWFISVEIINFAISMMIKSDVIDSEIKSDK